MKKELTSALGVDWFPKCVLCASVDSAPNLSVGGLAVD